MEWKKSGRYLDDVYRGICGCKKDQGRYGADRRRSVPQTTADPGTSGDQLHFWTGSGNTGSDRGGKSWFFVGCVKLQDIFLCKKCSVFKKERDRKCLFPGAEYGSIWNELLAQGRDVRCLWPYNAKASGCHQHPVSTWRRCKAYTVFSGKDHRERIWLYCGRTYPQRRSIRGHVGQSGTVGF